MVKHYKANEEEMQLKNIVEQVLVEDARSRRDNWRFFINVLRKLDVKIYMDYAIMSKLPSPESIFKMKRSFINSEQSQRFQKTFVPEVGVRYEKPRG